MKRVKRGGGWLVQPLPDKQYQASKEAGLLSALAAIQNPTTDELIAATGFSLTYIRSMIKVFCMPPPNGFGMVIDSKRGRQGGYEVSDWGVVNRKKLIAGLQETNQDTSD